MRFGSYLLLILTSGCCGIQDELNRLLAGEDASLDLENFWPEESSIRTVNDVYSSETHASAFLNDLNNELRQWKNGLASVEWKYETNISEHNRRELTTVSMRYQEWRLRRRKEAQRFVLGSLPENIVRQISLFTLSASSRDTRVNQRRSEIQGIMEGIYGSGQACLRNGSCLSLEPDLVNIMSRSRDPELLKEVWLQWRGGVGPSLKHHYVEFVNILNAGAIENGYSDYSEFWKQDLFYETPELDGMVKDLWTSIRPLYLQLHAYVRRKLREFYGSEVVGTDGTIPAHLLGNMWGQHWTNILDIVSPFPEANKEGQIEARLKAHVDVIGMFRLAENFYRSIGFFRMTPQFWKSSMFMRPEGRDVVCHASAFDFYNPGDYRIKMCSEVTYDNFRTIHHEMGHIEYFMSYSDQPTIFREGANAAFHEAVGDTIGLSVMSGTHLQALELVDDDRRMSLIGDDFQNLSRDRRRQINKQKSTINSLLYMALEKIAFLPFGLLVDTWRWGVMQKSIVPENYNKKWWEMRLKFQGLKSPVPRSENDFDPGSKYHIPANSACISYFISYIQQFQMYKALCQTSSYVGPLHQCDFYGSLTAGNKLRHVLSEGSSTPWQAQLRFLTGSDQVKTDAILEYFKPLYDWLILDNSVHQEKIGWEGANISWAGN